jgi:predicted RecA/RadA family phage recombinase
MSNTRVQNGRRITVTAGGAIVSGQPVVIGDIVGVAMTDAANGEDFEVAVSEVHNLPKLDAAVIAQGEKVALDISAGGGLGEVDDQSITPAAGDVTNFGIAWESKGATTGESIAVLLTPGAGTLN